MKLLEFREEYKPPLHPGVATCGQGNAPLRATLSYSLKDS